MLFSPPIFSRGASYYGGFETIATSDYNKGIRFETAIRIASADSEQEASILVEVRKITHIALPF